MNIGIIKLKDREYYIQKTNNTYKVECITNDKAYTLTKEETIDLVKNIFDSNMKKIGEENNITIYLDEANNKRFFENGEENFLYFFQHNGVDALLYQGKISDKFKELEKEFKMNSKAYGLFIMYLSIEVSMFFGILFGNAEIPEFPKEEYYFLATSQISSNELLDEFKQSMEGFLSEDKVDYLCNEQLLNDILQIATPARKHKLLKALQTVRLDYFSEEELMKKYDVNGMYSVIKNLIKLRDSSDDVFYDSAAHEVVHLLQDDNDYYFILEGCAEIIAHEYFGAPKISYKNPRKYISALMELIGSQPVFDCCFKGDTSSFENAIKAHLSPEEAKELLELFTHPPLHNEKEKEENERIETLILKMYENINHNDGLKDNNFASILFGITDNKYYFNNHTNIYGMDTKETYSL